MKPNYQCVLINASIGCAVLGLFIFTAYVAFGHFFITAIYTSDLALFQRLMPSKGTTSLQIYMAGLDQAVLSLAVYFVLSGLVLLLALNPLGFALSCLSFFAASLAIFFLLDRVPELIKPLRLDVIPYFTYRLSYLSDPVLGYRSRPFLRTKFANYRGAAYSPVFGIDVPPQSGTWQTDDEGFRNPAPMSSAEVAVIGSSMAEWGNNVEDTYPSRLEKALGGQTVVNLGKAGYGPLQYLEILKRYALEKRPQYVILTFYPAFDIDQLANWIEGRPDKSVAKFTVGSGQLFHRYSIAFQQTSKMLIDSGWTALELGLQQIIGAESIHPALAVISLPNGARKKMLFVNEHAAKSTEQLLSSPEWEAMARFLVDFKDLCEQHEITPVVVYIPSASEVYAQYSTLDSGSNWLAVRKSEIETRDNNEKAARILARKVGVQMISLLPSFRDAAHEGKLVYYQLDAHWNGAGREIAAKVTAQALELLESDSAGRTEKPNTKELIKNHRREPTIQEARLHQRDDHPKQPTAAEG